MPNTSTIVETAAVAISNGLAHKSPLNTIFLTEIAGIVCPDALRARYQGMSGQIAVPFGLMQCGESLQGLDLFMEMLIEPKPCFQALYYFDLRALLVYEMPDQGRSVNKCAGDVVDT